MMKALKTLKAVAASVYTSEAAVKLSVKLTALLLKTEAEKAGMKSMVGGGVALAFS